MVSQVVFKNVSISHFDQLLLSVYWITIRLGRLAFYTIPTSVDLAHNDTFFFFSFCFKP